METPFFSIMMPAYNAERYIGAALESILEQTFTDYEVVVWDDCSSDKTAAVVAEYAGRDPRIRLFRNEKNLGSCRTRRLAQEQLRGEFVAFLDSDDLWERRKLEIFAVKLEAAAKQRICVHSDALLIDAAGCECGESFQERFNPGNHPVEGAVFPDILCANWINLSSAVVPRAVLLETGGFRELDNMVTDDWDMWVRFARDTEFVFIPQCLTRYRVHEGGISSPHKQRQIAFAREQVFAHILLLYRSELPREILSRVCYLRAANAVVLRHLWQARRYFFESWVDNKFNLKALVRMVCGR